MEIKRGRKLKNEANEIINAKNLSNEELKEMLIKDGIIRKDNAFNTSWITYRSKNYDLSSIEGDSIQEKVYVIFHGPAPRCTICGKKAKFVKWSTGYREICGDKRCNIELHKQYLYNLALPKSQTPETVEKRNKTNLLKYGAENPLSSKICRDKGRATLLERTGYDTPLKNPETKKKVKDTNIKRYGAENPFQVEEFKEKSRKTLLERTGYDNPTKNPATREKARNTCNERYGADFYTQTDEYRERSMKTCMENWGVPSYLMSEDCKQKTEAYWMERIGVENNLKSKEYQEMIRQTNNALYNCDYPMQNIEIRKKAFDTSKRTKPELEIEMLLKGVIKTDPDITFESQCIVNDKLFDFGVYKNGELNTLVEVDGEYVHGLKNDANGYKVGGGKDVERYLKCPDNVKLITIDSNRTYKEHEEVKRIIGLDYDFWKNEMVKNIMNIDSFPFPIFSDKRMLSDISCLKKYKQFSIESRIGESTIFTYHKSIFKYAMKDMKSPIDLWNDKEELIKKIHARELYFCNLSSKQLYEWFILCEGYYTVDILSPSLCAQWIKDFCTCDIIFDPRCIFSTTLIASNSLGKGFFCEYFDDENRVESERLIKDRELNVITVDEINISGACLLTYIPDWSLDYGITSDDLIPRLLDAYRCKEYLFIVSSTEKFEVRASYVRKVWTRELSYKLIKIEN